MTDATEHRMAKVWDDFGPCIVLAGLLVFCVAYGIVFGSWFPLMMLPVGVLAGVLGGLIVGR